MWEISWFFFVLIHELQCVRKLSKWLEFSSENDLKECEPLPRIRGFAKSISSKVKLLHPFLISLWKSLSNKSVNWNGFGYKNFKCLKCNKLNRDSIYIKIKDLLNL